MCFAKEQVEHYYPSFFYNWHARQLWISKHTTQLRSVICHCTSIQPVNLRRLHYRLLRMLALVQLLSSSCLALQYRLPIFIHLQFHNNNLTKTASTTHTVLVLHIMPGWNHIISTTVTYCCDYYKIYSKVMHPQLGWRRTFFSKLCKSNHVCILETETWFLNFNGMGRHHGLPTWCNTPSAT